MKILIVEDQPNHMAEAIATLKSEGVECVTAENQDAASLILFHHEIDKIRLDGVITDIFMPPADKSPLADQPCGLRVVLETQKLGLPCVMCTAGYHHGVKYEWIHGMCSSMGWYMVDTCPEEDVYNAEAPHKNWKEALTTIQLLISRKSVE